MTFESHLKEIFLRNDIKHNPNREIFIDEAPVPNASKQSSFVLETCKLAVSNPQTKEQGQMDMQLELLIHDFERINIVSKVHDDVNFKEEVKSKYACEEVKEKHSEKEGPVGFLENAEAFHKKKSSHSSVQSQTDEVIENQCTDFVFESSSEKEGTLSFLEKVQFLQNLQMTGISPLSDKESSTVSDDGISVIVEMVQSNVCHFTCHSSFFGNLRCFPQLVHIWCFIFWIKLIILFLYLLTIYRNVFDRSGI